MYQQSRHSNDTEHCSEPHRALNTCSRGARVRGRNRAREYERIRSSPTIPAGDHERALYPHFRLDSSYGQVNHAFVVCWNERAIAE